MSLEVNIKKSFKTFDLDVDFTAATETLGFLGASGCGKSLTLRCIAGIETPDEGRIVVNDRVFFDSEKKINLTPQQRKSALLFQNYMLFPNLTVEKNVAAGIDKSLSKDEISSIVNEELKRFGLQNFEKRYPAQLSGGQQQRVALARMLAAKPDILMLDEPFSALDAHLKGILEQNLASLFDAFDGTILYVSHDIDEALRFCDRIAVVESGKILEIDSGDELVDDPHSGAAIRLSGCKNCPGAKYVDDHHIYVPKWGVTLYSRRPVPKDLKFLGIRASFIPRADGVGENNFHMKVERVSDSRFERTVMLSFLDRENQVDINDFEDEMNKLVHELYWRVPKQRDGKVELPEAGEELWVHIPDDRIYIVNQ